jgi:cytochrome P450
MRKHVPLMREIAEREVASWPIGEPFKLQPRMAKLTLEVILRIVFGVEEGSPLLADLRRELSTVINAAADLRRVVTLITLGPERVHRERRFADIFDPVDTLIDAVIEERRTHTDLEDRDDILSMLLLARHDDGTEMSNAELRDELVTLLIAGHETTATALSWAMERLTRNPAQYDRLEQTVAAGETEYADAVIKETLRLRPVLPFVVREIQEDVTIGGWHYPKGTWLTPAIHLVHRRPDIYPDPTAFKPERWLGVRPNPYQYFPFGGGVRRCIGSSFAETEMRVVLTAIVGAVRLEASQPQSERVRRRVITLVPSRGGEVIARRLA